MKNSFFTSLQQAAAVAVTMMLSAGPMPAWNATGHRAISFLAYSNLLPRARERVSQILRAHPDYADILSKGAPADPVDAMRSAFVTSSIWPDIIKGDPRFSDAPGAASRPLPGFPDMGRHQNWHYINTPFPAEFRSEAIDPENALNQTKAFLKQLRKDGPVTPEEVYALPWIIHLVTDLHQPLHTVARFRQVNGKIDQDKGGNACYVLEERSLHSLWDNILGTNAEDAAVARLAASLQDHQPQPKKKIDLRPETWIAEGVQTAGAIVYNFPGSCSEREHALRLPAGYRTRAKRVAFERAAMGAYRLATLLNEKLGK